MQEDNFAVVDDIAPVLALADGTVVPSFEADRVRGGEYTLFSKTGMGSDAGDPPAVFISEGKLIVRYDNDGDGRTWLEHEIARIDPGTSHHLGVSFGGDSLLIGGSRWYKADRANPGINSPFDGTIADIAVYDRQLGRDQIRCVADAARAELDERADDLIGTSLLKGFAAGDDDDAGLVFENTDILGTPGPDPMPEPRIAGETDAPEVPFGETQALPV